MKRIVLLSGCLLACLASAAVSAQSPAEPAPVVVETAPALRAEFAPLHWAPGTVASREDARIAAEIGGRVIEVAEIGSVLAKGDVLARLDDAQIRLLEQRAQADLARIQAELDLVRRQEERYATLVHKAGISGAQLDQVSAERRMREQDLNVARVTLEQARLQRRQAVVRAPFDGVVVERAVQQGEYLAVGAPVARLVNTSTLEVRTRAPVALAGRLRAGDLVTLRGAGLSSSYPLDVVVPVGDDSSRQLELRFAVVAGDGLAVGVPVQVGVPSDAPREAVGVPRDALVMRTDGTYVVRVTEGDLAQRVPVDTGASLGELVEVRGGIRAGDQLVVRGGERLQPGQPVQARPADLPTAAVAVARAQP